MRVCGDGNPCTCRCKAKTKAEPEMAQPGKALHVWVNDESKHRQPGHHQGNFIEQASTDEEHRHEYGCKYPSRLHAHCTRCKMSTLCSRVCSVDVLVDDSVQGHSKSTSANSSQQNPQNVNAIAVIKLFNSDDVADENERQRKQRMLDFYELSDLLEVHAFT